MNNEERDKAILELHHRVRVLEDAAKPSERTEGRVEEYDFKNRIFRPGDVVAQDNPETAQEVPDVRNQEIHPE